MIALPASLALIAFCAWVVRRTIRQTEADERARLAKIDAIGRGTKWADGSGRKYGAGDLDD